MRARPTRYPLAPASVVGAPDPRMQRTRPCTSHRGSPLLRHPFRGPTRRTTFWPFVILAVTTACNTTVDPVWEPWPLNTVLRCASHEVGPAAQFNASRLTGRVLSENGGPIAGAVVALRLQGSRSVSQVTTLADGSFTLAVPAGLYDAIACYPGGGFDAWTAIVNVSPAYSTADLEIRLALST